MRPRCTRLAGDPRMLAAPAGGRSPAHIGTGRIARAVRRPVDRVFARAGRTVCVVVVAAAGLGSRVVPRTGSAVVGSSGCAGARGRMKVCLRPGCCARAEGCVPARETDARLRLTVGTWREEQSRCRFLFGRNCCIQSFGSAGEGVSVSIYGLVPCVLDLGPLDMQTYRGTRLSPKHVRDRAHHGTCKPP